KINHLKQKFASTQKVRIDGDYESLGLTSSFAQEKNGNLWIGSDGNGLFYYDSAAKQYQHFHQDHPSRPLSSNAVVTTLIDREDNLWVGTWGGGINLLKRGAKSFRYLMHDPQRPASLVGNNILHMIQDRKGRIWIAAFNRGLDVYLPERGHFIHFSTESENRTISSNKVRTLAEDPEGNIWIGTQGDGLERITLNAELEVLDRQCFYCQTEEDEFAAMTIQQLFFDGEGKLWISSSGSGLFHLDQSSGDFTRYSKSDGLPSNLINALLEDEQGVFWGSTNVGLFSFDLTRGQITSYSKEDGLLADDYCKSSAFQARDGKIYFGGNNGFDEFYAEGVSQNEQVPPVFITRVSVGGEVIKSDGGEAWILNDQSIELTHRQNDLNFEFIALNYVQPAKNQYQFKLAGYDDQWREVGIEPTASYINIPPGSYTFQVRAANNDGKWNEQAATLSVYIRKPWYATYLAMVIYVALFLASLWWARNSIISKERLRTKLKGEQLELAKMQEVNSMKTQFFTNISHEFKTPLTLIMSTLQVLAAKTKNQDELLFSLMKKHTERLSNLINQVLDLSQADAGQAQLQARKQNIGDFLKRMSLSFRIYADEHLVSYKVVIPPEEIWIYFDAEKLEKVVTNLLSNAFKFTPEYGSVQLSLINQDQEVGIEVLDTGKGIHPTEQPFIFDRFYHSSPAGSHEGTGIGLSLSKQLIDLHQGRIDVQSAPGSPTRFTIWLPKGKEHLRPSDLALDSESRLDPPAAALPLDSARVEKEARADDSSLGSGAAKDGEKARILLVEDHADIRFFLESILTPDYQVYHAGNGVEGVEKARAYLPDIIISDVSMPDMDGYEFCRQTKSHPLTSHIFIIMLSVRASESHRLHGYAQGADDYLAKPFNPALLKLKIQNLLISRKQFREQVLNQPGAFLSKSASDLPPLEDEFLKQMMEIIEENISNPEFKVEHLCSELGASKSQLYRKLKSLTGHSPLELIRMIRLQRATQLLQNKRLRIMEITYKVGFN
ncbi:MAG: two-component regulator propeller domain-containing protein, partial [Bacteroidota bacterium]